MVEQTRTPTSKPSIAQCVPVCVPVSVAAPRLPPRRVLVVVNGPKPEAVARAHGTLDVNIRDALNSFGLSPDLVILDVVTSYEDDSPPLPEDVSVYAAVILGGSKFDVTDNKPWMHAMAAWIRVNVGRVPMLGICFGHQIIGHALGGEVQKNNHGVEAGTYVVRRTSDDSHAHDPIAAHLPTEFPVHLLHSQSIVRLPPGAVAFYKTEQEAHQLVRFAPLTYGTQFHPEFSAAATSTYLGFCGAWTIPQSGSKLPEQVNCNYSNSIIGRFVELALIHN